MELPTPATRWTADWPTITIDRPDRLNSFRAGLVNAVVPREQLAGTVREWADDRMSRPRSGS